MNPVSLPMQHAWDAAVAAFKEFIAALVNGELIANGVHPATGVRCELDPAEWARTGLILDVRNGDLIEGGYEHVRRARRLMHGHTVRWSAITLRAAIPEQKLGRMTGTRSGTHDVARREQGPLPNEKAYLRESEDAD